MIIPTVNLSLIFAVGIYQIYRQKGIHYGNNQ